jgi:hypothetical protein
MAARPRVSAEEITAIREGLVAALAAAWELAERGGPDLPGTLAGALQELSSSAGGAGALVRSRPGSWEAVDIRHLGATLDDWEIGL